MYTNTRNANFTMLSFRILPATNQEHPNEWKKQLSGQSLRISATPRATNPSINFFVSFPNSGCLT
jgi:hypothetical protein